MRDTAFGRGTLHGHLVAPHFGLTSYQSESRLSDRTKYCNALRGCFEKVLIRKQYIARPLAGMAIGLEVVNLTLLHRTEGNYAMLWEVVLRS